MINLIPPSITIVPQMATSGKGDDYKERVHQREVDDVRGYDVPGLAVRFNVQNHPRRTTWQILTRCRHWAPSTTTPSWSLKTAGGPSWTRTTDLSLIRTAL